MATPGCPGKKKEFNVCWTSLEADFDRRTVPDVDGDGCGSLVAEWDRESSLGVETGDNVGGVGYSGSLVGPIGVFFACCGGGMIWAGRCCCFFGVVFLNCFFSPSPSVVESLLSLLLFKFVEVSISSCCRCCSLLFTFSFFLFSVFVLVSFFFSSGFWFSMGFLFSPSVSVVLAGGDFRALGVDFLPRVTWFHPSSSLLLGSFPASAGVFIFLSGLFAVADVDGAGELFVDADINGVLDTIVAFAIVGAIDVVVVVVFVVTVVLVVFCGHDLSKWPICLQCQHCGFRPSTTTNMAWSS